ncbi:unnamed protein product [Cuscuta campestris]|uniref:Pentacotripeptide-repeat region of PRORP domain-containing protein n=1 Tax=Cuscuta campestris TaxID=132261 RepID=A0A484LM13_9ASTE|nr:unnamed protein product [Cuscuta campestris]
MNVAMRHDNYGCDDELNTHDVRLQKELKELRHAQEAEHLAHEEEHRAQKEKIEHMEKSMELIVSRLAAIEGPKKSVVLIILTRVLMAFKKILNRALLQDKKMEVALLSAKAQIVKSSDNSYRIEILDSLVQGLCVTEPEIPCSVLRYCLRIDGIMPSSSTIYLLLYRVCSLGMIDGAIQVLELMSDKRMKYPFDNFVCSFVICAFICFGKPELAVRFYDNAVNSGSLKPNVYTCTSVMSAYCRLGRISDVWSLVEVMGIDGLAPDVVFYSNWMYGYFREGRVQDALERYTKMVEGNITLDTVSYTILIDGFSKEGLVEKAVGFLYKMRKDGLNPNLVTYTAVLQGFCMKGKLDEAFSVLKLVENQGFQMDEFPYVILIDRVCREGDFHGAFELLGEMEKKGVKPGVVTYNAIINGLCKVGRTSDADDLSKGIVGDVITYSTLLHGYIREGNLMGILETRRRLEAADVCLDVVMCNVLIKGLFLMGLLEDARSVYEGMQDSGLEADVGTYSTMIYGYCKADRIDLALQIFDEFRTKYTSSASPNFDKFHKKGSVTVGFSGAVLKALTKYGKVIDAYRLITEAGNSLPAMDAVDYTIVIDGLCKGGQVLRALHLCDFAKSKGVTLSVVTYNCIINGLCHQGFLLDAFRLFDSLEKTNIYPSDITYGTLIATLSKVGLVQDCIMLLEKMLLKNIPVNIHIYNSIISGYIKLGEVQKAVELLRDVETNGFKPDEFTVSAVINGYSHKGDMEGALSFFAEFKDKNILPDYLGFMYLIRGLCAKGRMEESRSILREMLQSEHVSNILDRVDAGTEAESVQKRLNEPYARKALESIEFKNNVLERKSCSEGELETDFENDSRSDRSNIFHPENFDAYYSLIALHCSKGELSKANVLAKCIMSSS